MRLIIIGPQGSGKGTHAKKLAAKIGVPHISTGDILRETARQGTEEGRVAGKIMAAGELLPDEFMACLLKKRLGQADARRGFVLDGFPRTILQAEALEGIAKIDKVIYLNVPDGECVRRLAGRKTCGGCGAIYGNENPERIKGKCDACGSELRVREDDTEEAIRKRLAAYHGQTEPVLGFYRRKGLMAEIRVERVRQPEDVFREICGAIGI